jgi:hypothetical protein
MASSKLGLRRRVSRRRESCKGICFVRVGLEEASGRIWEASARRAGMVASLEGWVRRVVRRVVRVAVRVWVAGGMVRGGFVLIR